MSVRVNPALIEELLEVPRLQRWGDLVGLGRETAQLLALAEGSEAVREMLDGVLLADRRTEGLADMLHRAPMLESDIDVDELRQGILGAMLAKLTTLLPLDDPRPRRARAKRGPSPTRRSWPAKACAPSWEREKGIQSDLGRLRFANAT